MVAWEALMMMTEWMKKKMTRSSVARDFLRSTEDEQTITNAIITLFLYDAIIILLPPFIYRYVY